MTNSKLIYKFINILGVISLILLIYIMSFSIYNLPSADDFAFGILKKDNVFIRAFDSYFHGGSGRIFSNIIYHYFAIIGNSHLILYKIYPIISIIMFIVIIFFILKVLFRQYNNYTIISLTLIFTSSIIFTMDSLNDTFFWLGGLTNYFIPMCLFLLSFLLLYYGYKANGGRYKQYIFISLVSLIIFITSFSNEALFLDFFILYVFLFIYSLYKKNKRLYKLLIVPIIIFLIVFIFIVFSPGSHNRMDGNISLLWAFYRGLMTALEKAVTYCIATMIIPFSYILYVLLKHTSYNIPILFPKLSYKSHGLLFILLGIILSWAAHFTISYGLGAFGLPPRAKFIPQFFSIITFTIGNIYFLYGFNKNSIFNKNTNNILFITVIYLILILISSKDFTGSLLSIGEHKIYYNESLERMEYIENYNGNDNEIILKKIDVAPYPIAPIDVRMLQDNCNHYVNNIYKIYYKKDKCIRIENGIDGDNSKVKNIYRKIDYFLKDGARIWFYGLFKQ